MFRQQIDFACAILVRWVASACLQLPFPTLDIDSLTVPVRNSWARKHNIDLSPISEKENISLSLACLDILRCLLFVGLVSSGDLSPIDNDRANQRQAPEANTIVNQVTPIILRY